MGLFRKKETDEQVVKRLAGKAGGMIRMFKDSFNTPNGIDIRRALVFTASLAGHACHRAVKAEGGSFAVVTTNAGKKFYFGDDLNKYLLENRTSVVSFITAVTGVPQQDVLSIVVAFTQSVGGKELTVCGYDPKPLYEQVKSCWEGIYDNMTSKYCGSPAEWPVLFGIVVQNILLAAIGAGAPGDEAGRIAIECAAAVSKMDEDSF